MLLYEFETQGAEVRVIPPPGIGETAADRLLALEATAYAAAAAAFALLTLLLLVRARRTLPAGAMTLACGVNALWMGIAAVQLWRYGTLLASAFACELIAGCTWLAFLVALLAGVPGGFVQRRGNLFAAGVACLGIASLGIAIAYGRHLPHVSDAALMAYRLVIIIGSFVLLENLIRNTASEQWWSLKFLCIGLGGVLTFDFFLYADGLLFNALNRTLISARGAVYLVVVPLLFISTLRRQMWQKQIVLSHKSAFYSSAFLAAGGYLAIMALAAYYIRTMGGTWGPVVQAVFLFGAVMILLVFVSSGALRAFLRVVVAKHFFRYKYDYREEWLRFTRTIGEADASEPTGTRVIRAIADVLDSTGGVLWQQDGNRYPVTASLLAAAGSLGEDETRSLNEFLRKRAWTIDLEEYREEPEHYEGLVLPPAILAVRRGWILVPLLQGSDAFGFVLLLQPRAPRQLDWEDFDLLRLLGRHAASFLAEQQASAALAEAKEFDRFNRRTAFVVHDIKNVVSQLSLIAANIQRHGTNPDFVADLAAAIDDAVARMKALIERLKRNQEVADGVRPLKLAALLQDVVRKLPTQSVIVSIDEAAADLAVAANEERMRSTILHLTQNAIDATGGQGWVKIALGSSHDRAVIEVSDDGPGMAPEFVRTELFKPFHSTKSAGLGIGAFQCREYARELGGDIDVVSSPGSGTTMRITLPLAQSPSVTQPMTSVP